MSVKPLLSSANEFEKVIAEKVGKLNQQLKNLENILEDEEASNQQAVYSGSQKIKEECKTTYEELIKYMQQLPNYKEKISKPEFEKIQMLVGKASQRYKKIMEKNIHRMSSLKQSFRQESNNEQNFLLQKQQQQDDQQFKILQELEREMLRERQVEMNQIEQDVNKMNAMMKDIAEITFEQGQKLDIVTDQIEETKVNAEEAKQEINQADNFQKKSQKRIFWIAFILLVIAGGVVAIVFLTK